MPTTSNFGWTTPADTDLVKDGAAAIRTLANGIDTSLVDLKGGTTGQVLAKASNTDLDFTWSSVDPLTILDAKGDLITATAADTPARLAVGTNGQILTADSTAATGLKWATPSAGSFTELATGTLSGSTLSLTSISGAYKDLRLAVYNVRGSIDGVVLRGQLNGDTGTNYASTSFNSSDASNVSWPITYQTYSSNIDDTNNPGMFIIDFFDYANTKSWKIGQGLAINEGDTTAGSYSTRRATNWYKSTSAITQIDIFLSSSATFAAGTYTLWGIN